jgi:hypothetical protein
MMYLLLYEWRGNNKPEWQDYNKPVSMYLIFDCIHIHLNIRLFYESKSFIFLKNIVRDVYKKSVDVKALISENRKTFVVKRKF